MKKTSFPVVFFGSGPVAAASLELLNKNFIVEAVVTKPRAAHHKGSVPVIETAEKLGLPIHTVVNKRTLDELMASKLFTSKLGILIDFGIIVSQDVIDYFPLGIINSHFSLLPEWRGADPITFSILSGQKETGVSLMLLTAGMDEGPILAYGAYSLPPTITTPELTRDLIELSDAMLQEVVPAYVNGGVVAKPQDESQNVTYSRKLTKDDGLIDWKKPAEQIEREIRAYFEWPKSSATIAGQNVTITAGHVIAEAGDPGKVVKLNKQLVVYCGEHAFVIDSLKPAGKKEMTGQAFLAGYGKFL